VQSAVRDTLEQSLRLLELGEQVGGLGSWEWLPETDEQHWSDNLFRLFGLEPGAIMPTWAYMFEHMHPPDRERVARFVESTRTLANPAPIEYRILAPRRGVRHLRSTIAISEFGPRGAQRIVGAVQDVTEGRVAEGEIAALVAVTRALAEWDSFEEGADRLVRDLAEAMQFVVGALWLPHASQLMTRVLWSDSSLDLPDFESATFARCLPRGVELPGRVWEQQVPIVITDVLADSNCRRSASAARAGLHGAVAFPALYQGEVLAVLEFYHREEVSPTARLTDTLGAIGCELGEFIARRRGQFREPRLTPRELQVLKLAADGCSVPAIAELLGVGVTTIRTHMERIYAKLLAHNRGGAVAEGMRLGLIE
jgi:DNA-binding CsgD family transcriptional regulator